MNYLNDTRTNPFNFWNTICNRTHLSDTRRIHREGAEYNSESNPNCYKQTETKVSSPENKEISGTHDSRGQLMGAPLTLY